jgi:hypothetical protein
MLRVTDPRDPSLTCAAGQAKSPYADRASNERVIPQIDDFDRFVFVVGAPRCGTTTLAHFLKHNAATCSPVVKEPHFFAQWDLRDLATAELKARVEGDYLRRFFRAEPGRRVGIDASVTYLYAPEQLEPILRLWQDSRFVVSVRDPLAMLPSLHRRLIYTGDETIDVFEQAWAAIADRRSGRRIPRRCADPRWLLYDEAPRFSSYLERLFNVVGRERCLVMVFDDLEADPGGEYRRLMDFVRLEAAQQMDLRPRRESRAVRARWLQRVLKRPPNLMREFLGGEQFSQRFRNLDQAGSPAPPRAILSLRKRLLKLNQCAPKTQRLPESFQRQLCDQFRDEVEGLERILDRDLGHWLRVVG